LRTKRGFGVGNYRAVAEAFLQGPDGFSQLTRVEKGFQGAQWLAPGQ